MAMFRSLFLAGSLLLLVTHAEAKDKWLAGGFISQNAIYTSDNFMLGGTDDDIALEYRELALITRGGLTDSITFSAQALSRHAGHSENGSIRLDYLFLNWRMYDAATASHSLTAGRVKVPIGFFNDLRESPFTRNGALIPQSVYPDRTRNSMMSAEEVLLINEFRFTDWSLNIASGAGSNVADEQEARDNFDVNIGKYDLMVRRSPRWNVRVLADYQEGRLRFAYSHYSIPAEFDAEFHPLPNLSIPISGEVKGSWDLISVEFNNEVYSVTSEFFRANVTYNGVQVVPGRPDYYNVPQGGYVQFTYHASEKTDVFARYDSSVFDNEDANGKYYSSIKTFVPHFARYGTDYAVGVAHRPGADWLLRLDLHSLDGSMWMTRRDGSADYIPKQHWQMAVASVAWRF